jgi:predicted secreted hydrolase
MVIPFPQTTASPASGVARSTQKTRSRRERELPDDWPGPGPIDLGVHDLPHASSALEWWYVNTHVETTDGRELGLFAAFFRELKGHHPETGEPEYAHSITWALSDAGRERFYPYCAVDAGAPEFGLRKLDAGAGVEDERLNRAMREVLTRGRIPGPTRLLETDAVVQRERLELDYGGDQFVKRSDGSYELRLFDARTKTGCQLTFEPLKPPTRHGDDGVCHGVADELMFYYFIPRCQLSGSAG